MSTLPVLSPARMSSGVEPEGPHRDSTLWHAWTLTQAISPRPTVRMAVDSVTNSYPARRPVDGPPPGFPWAIHLAGPDGMYRLLGFDFDAHTTTSTATQDCERLCGFLEQVDARFVVCESGPSQGRHVWVALAEPVAAEAVTSLAHGLKRACPSLDVTPLANPATGCLRPPGAPHRHGGHSTVLSGDPWQVLACPTTTARQVARLRELVASTNLSERIPFSARTPVRTAGVDEAGNVYVPGQRRDLTAYASRVAATPLTAREDASRIGWTILVSAARAHWRLPEIAVLAATSPGLEHYRTVRDAHGIRLPRPATGSRSMARVLREDWRRAVTAVLTTVRPLSDGGDESFNQRAFDVSAVVASVQRRADGSPGRWQQPGGPSDRRVLDAVCLYVAQALSTVVEADIRRLALTCGLGRQTVCRALHRLIDDAWISLDTPAVGPHGHTYRLGAVVVHRGSGTGGSQVNTPPAGVGADDREHWITTLADRLEACAHDLFTPGGLGIHLGNVYARIPEVSSLTTFAAVAGVTVPRARMIVEALATQRLLVPVGGTSGDLWWRHDKPVTRDELAIAFGVAGKLAQRAVGYRVERLVWAWWLQEHQWLLAGRHTPGKRRRRRPSCPPAASSISCQPGVAGAYPRQDNGRLDHRRARRLIEMITNGSISP